MTRYKFEIYVKYSDSILSAKSLTTLKLFYLITLIMNVGYFFYKVFIYSNLLFFFIYDCWNCDNHVLIKE